MKRKPTKRCKSQSNCEAARNTWERWRPAGEAVANTPAGRRRSRVACLETRSFMVVSFCFRFWSAAEKNPSRHSPKTPFLEGSPLELSAFFRETKKADPAGVRPGHSN